MLVDAFTMHRVWGKISNRRGCIKVGADGYMADERENLEFTFDKDEEPETSPLETEIVPELDVEPEPVDITIIEPGLEPEELTMDATIAPPVDIEGEVITPVATQEHRPVWAMVILTVWILAFYAAFYYFLIGHRFEKFAMGGG